MEGAMRDDELFMPTQQQEDNRDDNRDDGDEMYLILAKAITERKCRVVQKREKLKLLINETKQLNEKLKSAKKERKNMINENEDVKNQKMLKITNINNVQESRATLETTVCDLNNKLSLEKAETKRKKDDFEASLKDAHETWESYKEQYENFPLAKKLRQIDTEIKRTKIEMKSVELDNADLKFKKKLKDTITEKWFHLSMVEIAKSYLNLQKKIEIKNELLRKSSEMRKLIIDIKSGKKTNQHIQSFMSSTRPDTSKEQPKVESPKKLLQFKIPEVRVTSPTPSDSAEVSTGETRLFNWGKLLNSASLSRLSKKSAPGNVKTAGNVSSKMQPLTQPFSSRTQPFSTNVQYKSSLGSLKEKLSYDSKKTPASLKLSSNNSSTGSTEKQAEVICGKRKSKGNEPQDKPSTEEKPQNKKVCNEKLQITSKGSETSSVETHDLAAKQTSTQIMNKGNKENIKPSYSKNLPVTKSFMTTVTGNNTNRFTTVPKKTKPMTSNLLNILSVKQSGQKKAFTSQNNYESMKNNQTLPSIYQSFQPSNNQNDNKEQETFQNDKQDTFGNDIPENENQQAEGVLMMMDPGSPAPDLIPVQNNSQPLSQGNISQGGASGNFPLSGGSDFMSPSDLDESSKLVYQRLMAESPPYVPSRGPDYMKTQKQATEEMVVRSQYFADLPSSDPQTANNAICQDDQPPPISSPLVLSPDSRTMMSVMSLSPLPGNLETSVEISPPKQNANKPDKSFSFNFPGEGPSQNKSSIFNLF